MAHSALESQGISEAVLKQRAADLLSAAMKAGATAADTVISSGRSLALSFRDGKLDEHERSEGDDLGLRVFVGKKTAIVSSHDTNPAGFKDLAERAVAMAKVAPDDAYAGLPDEKSSAPSNNLELCDETVLSSEQLTNMALQAEESARAVKGVTKTDQVSASTSHGMFVLMNSQGFSGSYASSMTGFSVVAIAGEGVMMERDYDYSYQRFVSDLEQADDIGRSAGERAVARLNPEKLSSGKRAIIFDRRVATSLIGHLLSAINGSSIARKTSFLKDKMGAPIFNSSIVISDDPRLKRGHRSKPFDGEGLSPQKINLVENGLLKSWLLDSATARELSLQSNARAERGVASQPSPASTNVILQPGTISVDDMVRDIQNGIYVTDLIGRGANLITGDYSIGCSGIAIENGQLTKAVSEITIAGSLNDIFQALTPANDLYSKGSIAAPSCFIGEMMVAGR